MMAIFEMARQRLGAAVPGSRAIACYHDTVLSGRAGTLSL